MTGATSLRMTAALFPKITGALSLGTTDALSLRLSKLTHYLRGTPHRGILQNPKTDLELLGNGNGYASPHRLRALSLTYLQDPHLEPVSASISHLGHSALVELAQCNAPPSNAARTSIAFTLLNFLVALA